MARPRTPIGEHGRISCRYREGRAAWVASCYRRDEDGELRPYEASGPSEPKARRALKKRLESWSRPGGTTLTAASTLADAAALYFVGLAAEVATDDKSPKTEAQYSSAWRTHIEPRLGSWELREINVQATERFLAEVQDGGAGKSTMTATRNVLTMVLELAVRYEVIERNPVRKARLSIGAREAKEAEGLAGEKFAECLAKLDDLDMAQTYDLVDLTMWMAATTDRIGNATSVLWEQFDLDAGMVKLGSILVDVPGGGQHRRTNGPKATKRRVNLTDMPVLLEMLRARRNANPDATVVFPRPYGAPDRFRSVATTRQQLLRAFRAIGFEGTTPHDFRRAGLTHLLNSGIDLEVASRFTGHKNLDTTRGYIGQLDQSRVSHAMSAVLAFGQGSSRVTPLRVRAAEAI